MTAPQDPFRSPEPGQPPHGQGDPESGSDPYRSDPYGADPSRDQYRSDSSRDQYSSDQYRSDQYGSPGYGAVPYGSAPRSEPRNGLGIAALVLGVIALLTGLFVVGAAFGIAAVVLGVLGRARVKRGEANNGGMALAGIVLGILGVLLSILVVIGVTSLFRSAPVGDLAACLRNAGDDRAAQQQCEAEFERGISGG